MLHVIVLIHIYLTQLLVHSYLDKIWVFFKLESTFKLQVLAKIPIVFVFMLKIQ